MYKIYHHSWHKKQSYKIYNINSRGLALLFARLLCFIISIEDLVVVEDISNNSEKIIGIKSCFKKFRVL